MTWRATPKTLHWGYFDASLAPVLKVKPPCTRSPKFTDHHHLLQPADSEATG